MWSGGAHHAEEGQTNGDGGPALVDDSVRSTWSTIKVAGVVEGNHNNHTVYIMVSSYTVLECVFPHGPLIEPSLDLDASFKFYQGNHMKCIIVSVSSPNRRKL